MKKYYKVAKIFGIDIVLHYSWFLIFFFLSYVLVSDYFPQYFPGLSQTYYLIIGISSALLLFVSVLAHELCHSLVAQAHNIPIKRIQLFFFGGVAEIPDDDITPGVEFVMAMAGPVFSIVFGLFCLYITPFVSSIIFQPILHYLGRINLVLGIFNLLPGFPLDGGRAFRAVLWFFTDNLEKATYIASRSGKAVGGMLILLGFFAIFGGNFGGLWFILIGAFLFFIAEASFQQVVMKTRLIDVTVKDVYTKDFDKLPPNITVTQALQTAIHSTQDFFPVIDKNKFLGLISIQRMHTVPKPVRHKIKLKEIMLPAKKVPKVTLKSAIYPLLMDMAKNGSLLLPVIKGKKIIGIITRDRVMHYLKIKMNFDI